MTLYVAKDRDTTAVSRTALRVPDGRRVRRSWTALIEDRIGTHHSGNDAGVPMIALMTLPAVVVALAAARYLGALAALVAGSIVLFITGPIVPLATRRRRRRSWRWRGPGAEAVADRAATGQTRLLTAESERTTFDGAMAAADRVADTWPALDGLIDTDEAGPLLAEALWEIAGVLTRRQELKAVLAGLTRPDFAGLPADDPTAARLQDQIRATKQALSAVEIDLATRQANLRRAEDTGRSFIRERDMREAIQAAERSLRATQDPALPAPDPAATPTHASTAAPAPAPDPAADLAEHTEQVLAAYRELTTTPHPNDTE
ncbi:hypothetical protein [Paractinoplanes globisporus]|uniref:Integral membrane protein n=1 Tax=Paractinoplanes globisporus TaxID=113565 RepID=A0ABW6WMD2_9ACTN|nr:hypothetical protein [Actinoplanes globisporus]